MTTWRIAWRNLWRNPRRTVLALSAIGLSVTLVLVYSGILRGYADWMLATVTGPMLGHAQVHAPGWRKTRAMDTTLRHVSSTLETIRRDEDVAAASARVYAPALAALGEDGFAVAVIGVDWQAESQPGRLLAGISAPPVHGQVLMGNLLADQMGVRAGAVVALVGQGADGSLANDLFTVAAVISTPVDVVNRQGIVMAIDEAQTLLAMPDEAHEIVVYARDPAHAPSMVKRLGASPALQDIEILDWQTLAPQMLALIELVQAAWMFILLLVFAAAAAGVANTMLMATFERTHEFGMLLALGAAPRRIVALIGLESIALGLSGALIGTVLGTGLVALVHGSGVDFAALTGGGPKEIAVFGLNWSLRLYPSLAAIDVLRVAAAVVITSVLASVWPAARAAGLEPVRALRE